MSTFPIRSTPDEFDKFFKRKVGALYDERARQAFRRAQQFFFDEHSVPSGVALPETYEERAQWHPIIRLNRLWNIDKHRRLAIMA